MRIRLTGSRLKTSGVRDVDAVMLGDEVVGLQHDALRPRLETRHHAVEHRHGLRLALFQCGAQDRGEVADILGDQKVVLHEAFDVAHAGMRRVAEADCDLALDVEREPLLGPPGDEMHVAAHRPEEILGGAEHLGFRLIEHAALDQLLGAVHAVDILRDPEQRVQVAQAAFAVLHVRLDQIARLTGAAQPLLALGELGGDELRAGVADDVLVETRHELIEQRTVAEQVARFEQRRADGHVGLCLAHALVDRARRVADFEPHVPQAIENAFGDQLAPRGLLVGKEKQQIDIGAGREQPAAVTAGRDHGHPLAIRRRGRAVELADEIEQHADDLILHHAQPFRAGAAVAVVEQHLFGGGAALTERSLEALRDGGAHLALASGIFVGEPGEFGRDRGRVDQRRVRESAVSGREHQEIRIAECRSGVTLRQHGGRRWAPQASAWWPVEHSISNPGINGKSILIDPIRRPCVE